MSGQRVLPVVPDGARVSELDRLRRGPVRVPGPQMGHALERAAEIGALGMGGGLEGVHVLGAGAVLPDAATPADLRHRLHAGGAARGRARDAPRVDLLEVPPEVFSWTGADQAFVSITGGAAWPA